MSRWLRGGAITFAILALAASAMQVSREESGRAQLVAPGIARDPLAAELDRCNTVGPAGARDQACERVWAESRRRFLGARAQAPEVSAPEAARPNAAAGQP